LFVLEIDEWMIDIASLTVFIVVEGGIMNESPLFTISSRFVVEKNPLSIIKV